MTVSSKPVEKDPFVQRRLKRETDGDEKQPTLADLKQSLKRLKEAYSKTHSDAPWYDVLWAKMFGKWIIDLKLLCPYFLQFECQSVKSKFSFRNCVM